jgi:hypothetical protein
LFLLMNEDYYHTNTHFGSNQPPPPKKKKKTIPTQYSFSFATLQHRQDHGRPSFKPFTNHLRVVPPPSPPCSRHPLLLPLPSAFIHRPRRIAPTLPSTTAS